ncbi:hypothetical protein VCHA37P192_110161 [Vibrio chagasii]|nr:hypothetical protein VCHA37P192_110161 [Vibrio chagasii]
MPVGAKPKGGSVPKCSLLASNSKLKDAASLKGLISRFFGLLGRFLKSQQNLGFIRDCRKLTVSK